MLIINIISNENKNYKGRFFKKQVRPVPFERNSLRIRGIPCTIIEFNESMLSTLNLEKLFNTFKGRILGSDKVVESLVPVEYRFNSESYLKRALLSSLLKNIGKTANNFSITIKDDDFVFSKEYEEISKNVKSLTLVAKDNEDINKFCNLCFVEYGIYVNVSETKKEFHDDVFLDFNDMDVNGKVIIKKEGMDQLLYPDPQFFMISDDLRPFLRYGISPKLLCAAFETIQ